MTDTPKVPLVLKKPPKPISQMTDEERHEFAGRIYEAIERAYRARPR